MIDNKNLSVRLKASKSVLALIKAAVGTSDKDTMCSLFDVAHKTVQRIKEKTKNKAFNNKPIIFPGTLIPLRIEAQKTQSHHRDENGQPFYYIEVSIFLMDEMYESVYIWEHEKDTYLIESILLGHEETV